MKKISAKGLIAAVVLTALVCTVGAGTYAKYVFGAKSENNVVRAASFEVGLGDADQMKSARFSLDKFNPFSEPVEYPITINKNNTEVPVKYELSVQVDETNKGLFEGESPIKMELLRKVGSDYQVVVPDFLHNSYTLNDLHYDENLKPAAIEEFKVRCSWVTKSDEIDTTYQQKTGKFDVIFNAEQVKDAVERPHETRTDCIYFRVDDVYRSVNHEYKYYKDAQGRRVLDFGDVDVERSSGINLISFKNLVLTETGAGTKLYTVNCDSVEPSYWKGKTLKYREYQAYKFDILYFTDVKNDNYNHNEMYISNVSTENETNIKFIEWLR